MSAPLVCTACGTPTSSGFRGASCLRCGHTFSSVPDISDRQILEDAALAGFGANQRNTLMMKISRLYRLAFEKGRASNDS